MTTKSEWPEGWNTEWTLPDTDIKYDSTTKILDSFDTSLVDLVIIILLVFIVCCGIFLYFKSMPDRETDGKYRNVT